MPDGSTMIDETQRVAGAELRSFIERIERQNAMIKDEQAALKEIYDEAKGRGYMITVIRKVVKLRARDADDLAEEEAVLDMYKSALGM